MMRRNWSFFFLGCPGSVHRWDKMDGGFSNLNVQGI